MSSVSLPKVSFFLLLIIIFAFLFSPSAAKTKCHITSIYQFGDSLVDAGNAVILTDGLAQHTYGPPYGETYFKRPTGRYSDGRIITDFIAYALNIPLLNAYLDKNASFSQGVNFAYAGATVLNNSFWAAQNVILSPQNMHLTTQLGWLKSHLQSTYGSDCRHALRKSLVIMGEIGGADYIFSFGQGKKEPEMRRYVPFVVSGVIKGIRDVIQLGATRILVPGVLPFGCLPGMLNSYATSDPNAYDSFGCLTYLNDFCSYHNAYLKMALEYLRWEFPYVKIVYGDYYGAYMDMFRSSSWYGFSTLTSSCCGGGGKYNANAPCGSSATVCPNPSQYVSWDGGHMTDAGNHHVADFVLDDMLLEFKCNRFGDSGVLSSY